MQRPPVIYRVSLESLRAWARGRSPIEILEREPIRRILKEKWGRSVPAKRLSLGDHFRFPALTPRPKCRGIPLGDSQLYRVRLR